MSVVGRIRVDVDPSEFSDVDELNAAQSQRLEELLSELAEQLGTNEFSVEVEYRDPVTGEFPDWELSGDAIHVFMDTQGGVIITTLPPYSEEAP